MFFILDPNPLSDVWFANVFFLGLAFFLIVSCGEQNILNWIRDSLLQFSLITGYAFGVLSNKFLPNPRSQLFFSVFSSRRFIVLGFIFRSVIYFELVFVYGTRYELKFFFYMTIQWFQHY